MAGRSPRNRVGAAAQPPLVGIGASAGGLAAIQTLFDHIPPDTGAAFIVVQHLSPDFKSLMDEILARHTQMRIVCVKAECVIEPDSIYLLQPRDELHVVGDQLLAKPRGDGRNSLSYPVDTLFDSMANRGGDPGIAIVLSGTGSDGSRGVRRIKEKGGLVIVQSPDSAEFDGMPNAAIATGCVDRILDPPQIAELVERLAGARFAGEESVTLPPSAEPYERILELLKQRADYDLTTYKPGTITRRIERRMALHHLKDPSRYIELLENDADEVQQLAQDCLIHVTYFFRDPRAFEALELALREAIAAESRRRDTFRVWVAGCSTGEEVYSIAAVVDRVIRELGAMLEFKIFATDIDENALNTASAGRYPITALIDIPKQYHDMVVRQNEETVAIQPALRNRVVFARHNVLRDPPFPRADLITCRNLLIYLDSKAQASSFDRFLFSLRRGGMLMLGSSESVECAGDGFKPIDSRHRLFRKAAEPRRALFDRKVPALQPTRPRPVPAAVDNPLPRACERLIELFGDAGIVVSDVGEVIHGFGDVARWLRLPKGAATTRLEDLLPEESRASALLALRQARSSVEPVRAGQIQSHDGAAPALLDVINVDGDDDARAVSVLLLRRIEEASALPVARADLDVDDIAKSQIETLESELATTRENLQSSIEELETTNEELQSVNEELLASNEELQSTNEELHSVNEELYTVNSEHQQKIGELVDVTEDLEHLLQATQVGTLFLDKTLTIRRFTPSATMALPLRAQDVGRSLHDLHTHLVDADLAQIVRDVIDSGEPVERRFVTERGVPLHVGVHPYRRGSAGGAVLTFVDVRRLEQSSEHASECARILGAIDRGSNEVIRICDAESLGLLYLSSAFEKIWGYTVAESKSHSLAWMEQIHPDDRERVEQEFYERARKGTYDSEYRIVRPDGVVRWIRDRGYLAEPSEPGDRALIIGVAEDVTARTEAARERLREREMHRIACTRTRVPMLFVDVDGNVQWLNDAANRLFGGSRPAAFANLIADAEEQAEWRRCAHQVASGSKSDAVLEADLALPDDRLVRFQIDLASVAPDCESVTQMVCQLVDLSSHVSRTEALAAQAEELESEALSDPLTRLSNRRGANRQIERILRHDRRRHEPTMAILIDCDNFKHVNDVHGYDGGDSVLRAIAERIRRALRPDDIAARVGGDEFLAVISAARLAEAAHVGDKLRRAVADEPVMCGDVAISTTVSVGVVQIRDDVNDVEGILAHAGDTLQRSKTLGRNRVSFADEKGGGMPTIQQTLDGLLESRELRVVRQTLNSTATGEVVGYELLTRGPEPWVQPAMLFDLFRRHDRLADIDVRCLEFCVDELLQGRVTVGSRANATANGRGSGTGATGKSRKGRSGGKPGGKPGGKSAGKSAGNGHKAGKGGRLERCHINLLPSSLVNGRWGEVREILSRIEDPSCVTLELSEQQFVGPSSRLRSRLTEVRKLGFRVAIDDIGFGRSALETLLAVEPEVVKVDRNMVRGIERDAGRRRVLERLVQLLDGMSCEIVAEGVELDSQRQVLCDLGVPFGQGFLWSHPDRRNN